jgi:hypothetical protein
MSEAARSYAGLPERRREIPVLSQDKDPFSLAADVVRALTNYPFCARIPEFGVDGARGKSIARLVANTMPLHPRKPFGKLTFTEVKIDPVAFAKDEDGTRYSRTNIALGAHTDWTYLVDPFELVAFQMVRPDAAGGENFITVGADALAALDPAHVRRLAEPVFSFSRKIHPIAWGDGLIRYYRTQIDEDLKAGAKLSPEHLDALSALDEALERHDLQIRFKLGAGEIVFVNNVRALHGRTGFEPTSARLMYRIRANAGCLYSGG